MPQALETIADVLHVMADRAAWHLESDYQAAHRIIDEAVGKRTTTEPDVPTITIEELQAQLAAANAALQALTDQAQHTAAAKPVASAPAGPVSDAPWGAAPTGLGSPGAGVALDLSPEEVQAIMDARTKLAVGGSGPDQPPAGSPEQTTGTPGIFGA